MPIRQRNTGMTSIAMIVMIGALFAMISFGVDFGHVQLASHELEDAAEAAARNAVNGLVDGTWLTRAQSAASDNRVDGRTLSLQAADVETGTWDSSTKTFTSTSTNPNAVRVKAQLSSARSTAVNLTFASMVGMRTCEVRATCVAYFNPNVMLVVNNTTLSAADQLTYNRIAGLGYHVVPTTDANVTSAGAADMRLVVVSETCVSSVVNTKLRDAAVPVVCYEPFLCDDLGLTGPTTDTDYGLTTNGNRLTINLPAHALAGGLSGTVYVTNLPDTTSNGGMAWGKIAGGTFKVAEITGESTHAGIYALDTGGLMYNGSPAPARRVCMFGSGPLGSFTGGAPASTWTANGWTLFDAAVSWAIGTKPNIKTVRCN